MRLAHRITTLAAALIGALAMLALPAVAAAKDGNHDRIPDRWEKRHHLSTSVNQAGRDQDRDHLRNRAEFLAGDNPRDSDSDDDGVIDGSENAGTIASFDAASGKLTITLFGGETTSGLVTDQTEIKCEDSGSTASASSDEGSNQSSGENEPDDDNGQGDEPGDDNGGDDNSGPGSSNSGPGGGDDGESANCTTADLVVGATIEEADLHLENGTATFDEVELAD
ncbi:MAG: hypothetical protein QOF13_220 [Solirubrobacterales bacterium]|jgi:hypothetical protein|nr:hypothetical protein [Solirubrobacterales bacterium]